MSNLFIYHESKLVTFFFLETMNHNIRLFMDWGPQTLAFTRREPQANVVWGITFLKAG